MADLADARRSHLADARRSHLADARLDHLADARLYLCTDGRRDRSDSNCVSVAQLAERSKYSG